MTASTKTSVGNRYIPPLSDTVAGGLLLTGVLTALTLGTAFGLLAVGFEYFWIVFPLGFGVVLPTALGLVGSRHASSAGDENNQAESSSDTALKELRQQYVGGELSDEEFERRLERLLENSRQ